MYMYVYMYMYMYMYIFGSSALCCSSLRLFADLVEFSATAQVWQNPVPGGHCILCIYIHV